MKVAYTLFFTLFITLTLSAQSETFETQVRNAVSSQLKLYPKSTLKDLYKFFFQDKFGPGHIISDTSAAMAYLQKELNSTENISGEIAVPTGWEGNFYRVNLSVIKNGTIPLNIFFNAFIKSAGNVKAISVEEWRSEWKLIEKEIKAMNINLPNYDNDCNEIKKQLDKDNFVGHHSTEFNKTYAPHYRIINKKIYEEELLPLLK